MRAALRVLPLAWTKAFQIDRLSVVFRLSAAPGSPPTNWELCNSREAHSASSRLPCFKHLPSFRHFSSSDRVTIFALSNEIFSISTAIVSSDTICLFLRHSFVPSIFSTACLAIHGLHFPLWGSPYTICICTAIHYLPM